MNTKLQYRHPLITEFIDEVAKQRNWSEGVKRNTTYVLTALLKALKKEPSEITEKDIIKYCIIRKEREFWTHSNTLLNSLWIIRMFCKFLFTKGIIAEAYQLKIKLHKELPENIDRSVYSAVRKQKNMVDRYATDIRDKALWYLIYFSTAFITDIPNIKLKNVDLEKGFIYLEEVKSGRLHYIILQDEAIQVLKLYLARCKIDSEYLFPKHTDNSQAMSSGYISVLIRNIAIKSGVRITNRERMELKISIAIQANVDIHTLQCMFGVKNLNRFQEHLDKRNNKLKPFKEMRKMNRLNKKHNLI